MDTLQTLYNSAERIVQLYEKILFLETCHYFKLTPKGLKIKKRAESARSEEIQRRWDDVLSDASRTLTRITIEEEITSMKIEEQQFWSGIDILRSVSSGDVSLTSDWL